MVREDHLVQRLPAWSADALPDVSPDVGPDHALVAAIRADPAAFDLLYRQYYERVLAYARARAATSEVAADLTQQIFLRAFAAFTTYHPARGSLAAWLFGIARNAAVDLQRRQRVAQDTQYLPLADSPASTDPPGRRAARRGGGPPARAACAALRCGALYR